MYHHSNQSSKKLGRKGVSDVVAKFILVLIVVVVLIVIFNRVMKGGTKVLECSSQGGECTKGTCELGKQIPMLADKAAGCDSGYICCKNIEEDVINPDPECDFNNIENYYAIPCGVNKDKVCNIAKKCVSIDTYCSENCIIEDKKASDKGIVISQRICRCYDADNNCGLISGCN